MKAMKSPISELVDGYLSNPDLCFKVAWSELEMQENV